MKPGDMVETFTRPPHPAAFEGEVIAVSDTKALVRTDGVERVYTLQSLQVVKASAQVGDMVRLNRYPDTTGIVWDTGTIDDRHVAYVRMSGSGNVALTSDTYEVVPAPKG